VEEYHVLERMKNNFEKIVMWGGVGVEAKGE
jgi:hypothetical protein